MFFILFIEQQKKTLKSLHGILSHEDSFEQRNAFARRVIIAQK